MSYPLASRNRTRASFSSSGKPPDRLHCFTASTIRAEVGISICPHTSPLDKDKDEPISKQDETVSGSQDPKRMDSGVKIWGLPEEVRKVGKEVDGGVRVINSAELLKLVEEYSKLDTPTSVLFPWLHGLGDGPEGARGGPLEQFFGNPPLDPPRYCGLTILRAPDEINDPSNPNSHQECPCFSTGDSPHVSVQGLPTPSDSKAATPPSPDGAHSRSPTPIPFSATIRPPQEPLIANPDAPDRMRAASVSTESSDYSTEPSLWSISHSPISETDGMTPELGDIAFGGSPASSMSSIGFDFPGKGLGIEIGDEAIEADGPSKVTQDSIVQMESTSVEMHPTCVKAAEPAPSRTRWLMGKSSSSPGKSRCLINPAAKKPDALNVDTSVFGPSKSVVNSPSPIRSDTSTSRRPSLTPETPTSADPSEENSTLRFLSTRSRSPSPIPSRPGTPGHRSPFPSRPGTPAVRSASATSSKPGAGSIQAALNAMVTGGSSTSAAAGMSGSWMSGGSGNDVEHLEYFSPEPENQSTPVPTAPPGPSSMLINAVRLEDVIDLGMGHGHGTHRTWCPRSRDASCQPTKFKKPDLSQDVSLRNLKIQEIKYATISDLVVYAPGEGWDEAKLISLGKRVAHAQDVLHQERTKMFFTDFGPPYLKSAHHQRSIKESVYPDMTNPAAPEDSRATMDDFRFETAERENWQTGHYGLRPIEYKVYVVADSFKQIEENYPQLIGICSRSLHQNTPCLFHREAEESNKFTAASEILDGLWIGNGQDNPFRPQGKIHNPLGFDLVIETHDLAEMPSAAMIAEMQRILIDNRQLRQNAVRQLNSNQSSFVRLPEPAYLECGSSSRSFGCSQYTIETTADRLVNLVEAIKGILKEGEEPEGNELPTKTKVLMLSDDGYTETSIFALAYLMSSLEISLPAAYIHLQLNCNRSFFVYPFDVPFLQRVEQKLYELRSARRSPRTGQISKWKPWNLPFGRAPPKQADATGTSRESVKSEDFPPSTKADAKGRVWLQSPHFDGSLPSRILPHMYLGNIGHASNPYLLRSLGITHVVSVGETIMNESRAKDYYVRPNRIASHVAIPLSRKERGNRAEVLEVVDVKDDGHDPLRPKIAMACDYIEKVRRDGGKTLIHCRVGVSRSATIVIAYLMRYEHMSLIDGYLMTRSRRLNVLIQPNLRFLHELLGWETELEAQRASETGQGGMTLRGHCWPSLCRDIYQLNRRFLS